MISGPNFFAYLEGRAHMKANKKETLSKNHLNVREKTQKK